MNYKEWKKEAEDNGINRYAAGWMALEIWKEVIELRKELKKFVKEKEGEL